MSNISTELRIAAKFLEMELPRNDDAGTMREAASHIECMHDIIGQYQKQVAGLQAKIDALMLEYCPSEMTPEQRENWAKHLVAATPEEAEKIRKALVVSTDSLYLD